VERKDPSGWSLPSDGLIQTGRRYRLCWKKKALKMGVEAGKRQAIFKRRNLSWWALVAKWNLCWKERVHFLERWSLSWKEWPEVEMCKWVNDYIMGDEQHLFYGLLFWRTMYLTETMIGVNDVAFCQTLTTNTDRWDIWYARCAIVNWLEGNGGVGQTTSTKLMSAED